MLILMILSFKDPEFNPDKVVQKSVAAAGLCAWVINLHRYHQVFLIVGPKQQALQDSHQELLEARERLQYLKGKINNLEAKLAEIQAEFENAVAEKQRCQRRRTRPPSPSTWPTGWSMGWPTRMSAGGSPSRGESYGGVGAVLSGRCTAFMRNQLLNLIYILCASAIAVIASPATSERGWMRGLCT